MLCASVIKALDGSNFIFSELNMSSLIDHVLQPTLIGPDITIRPLQPSDWNELYAVASDPLIWEQHPNPSMYTEPEFRKYFDGGVNSKSAFVVLDQKMNSVIGTSRYYDVSPESSSVSIGFTFLARAFWGGNTNKELKGMMIDHALMYFNNVCFHIAKGNIRSRKAIEKIGASLTSEFNKVIYGKELEYCLYRIAREDWQS